MERNSFTFSKPAPRRNIDDFASASLIKYCFNASIVARIVGTLPSLIYKIQSNLLLLISFENVVSIPW